VRRVAEAHSGPIFDALFPFDMNDRFGTVSQDGVVRYIMLPSVISVSVR